MLDRFVTRVQAMHPERFGLDAESHRTLVARVQQWRAHVRELHSRQHGVERPGPGGLRL